MISSSRSCSATRAAPSPARSVSARVSLKRRTRARCCSTKWASCRRARRPRCCASSRKESCAAWVRTCRAVSTSAWCRPPIATFAWKPRPAASGSTCSTVSTSSASACRRCAIAARTFRARGAHLAGRGIAMRQSRDAQRRRRRGPRAVRLARQRPRTAERPGVTRGPRRPARRRAGIGVAADVRRHPGRRRLPARQRAPRVRRELRPRRPRALRRTPLRRRRANWA